MRTSQISIFCSNTLFEVFNDNEHLKHCIKMQIMNTPNTIEGTLKWFWQTRIHTRTMLFKMGDKNIKQQIKVPTLP